MRRCELLCVERASTPLASEFGDGIAEYDVVAAAPFASWLLLLLLIVEALDDLLTPSTGSELRLRGEASVMRTDVRGPLELPEL